MKWRNRTVLILIAGTDTTTISFVLALGPYRAVSEQAALSTNGVASLELRSVAINTRREIPITITAGGKA